MGWDFSIAARAAWAPGLAEPGDWKDWAAGRREILRSDAAPDLSFLPPLSRRRLGQLDRMVLHAGHEALGGRLPTRTLLATRYGEIGQQYKIGAELAGSSEVSPAAFSLSVFNAPASLLSIAEHNGGEATTIHSGAASFSAGLACCLAMLGREPSPLLFITADELLPEAYVEIEGGRGLPFALAMLISAGREGPESFSVESSSAYARAAEEEPEALRFLRWLLGGAARELRLGGSEMPLAISRPGEP